MQRLKKRRKKIAERRSIEKRRLDSEKASGSLRARILGAGAALLAIVGYLSAGDKLADLGREWGHTIQQGILSIGISNGIVRKRIASNFVDANFGSGVCQVDSGPFDLEKDGRSTDLVILIRPQHEGVGCDEILNSSLVVLENSGWKWFAIEMIPPPSNSVQYRWRNGYIFGEVFGTDFPYFSIFARSKAGIEEIHTDFGELPVLDAIFPFEDRYRLLVSGREGDALIHYDHQNRQHRTERIERQRKEWSGLHVVSSVRTGGWAETYSFDGETLNENAETGVFLKYLGVNELVFVPTHCDTINLSVAPSFPGYFIPDGQGQARICCPVDVEEYGSCADISQVDGDPDALAIELH